MIDWPTILRDTRARLGVSQARLASLLTVTRQTVENWEAGRSEPAHPEMTKMALEHLALIDSVARGRSSEFYDYDIRLLAMAHGWEDTLGTVPMAEVVKSAEDYLTNVIGAHGPFDVPK